VDAAGTNPPSENTTLSVTAQTSNKSASAMLDLSLRHSIVPPDVRLCAVSYLNTLPLVWGFLSQGIVERQLSFRLPAGCAEALETGAADVGLVPVAELERLKLQPIPGTGIACDGPVRSILLVSKVDFSRIRTLAADSSSRTSVMLLRLLLERRYGVEPEFFRADPDLHRMLARADAALIIGDPALHLDHAALPYHVLDLGAEWTSFTGLPMVFAVWAGRHAEINDAVRPALEESREYGLARIEEIVESSAAQHGVSQELAHEYLTRHIVFRLGDREQEGLDLFLKWAAERVARDEARRVSEETSRVAV
jgi:chorismate dehydratase